MRAHADDLRVEVEDEELVEAIVADFRAAPLARISSRAAAMCAHAVKLTESPGAVGVDDVDKLREAGCDDAAIHDLTQVAALFAYFNRVADGLGIDPEPDWV